MMRPAILACFLALCFAASLPDFALAAEQVDFKTFLKNPEKYDDKEILLSGFLSLEDYSKALFLTQEDYAEGRFENSVPIIVPRNILNIREAFQRTFVKIRAEYHHGCARPDVFCSAHPGQGFLGPVLELWGEHLPKNERPVYRKPAIKTIWDELSVSEAEDPDHEDIIQLAYTFSKTVTAGDKSALLALFEKESRKQMETDLNTPESRSDWLLFSGQYNYRAAFLASKLLTIVPLRMKGDTIQPQVAAACFCLSADCLDQLSHPMPSDAVTTGSFVDPYKCVPFYKSKSGWMVDGGFLLSFDEESPYGNDVGIVGEIKADGGGKTVAGFVYTHPSYAGSPFLTRLRERPRPRAVDAMQKGRVNFPIYYVTPSEALWVIERSGGQARIRQIKQDN